MAARDGARDRGPAGTRRRPGTRCPQRGRIPAPIVEGDALTCCGGAKVNLQGLVGFLPSYTSRLRSQARAEPISLNSQRCPRARSPRIQDLQPSCGSSWNGYPNWQRPQPEFGRATIGRIDQQPPRGSCLLMRSSSAAEACSRDLSSSQLCQGNAPLEHGAARVTGPDCERSTELFGSCGQIAQAAPALVLGRNADAIIRHSQNDL